MNILRIRDSETVRPLDVVLICIVVMTVAGGALLLSAAKPTAPVDGAIEWHTESPLRALVELLCLNYQVPTNYPGDVKNFILALGAGLAAIAASIAIAAGSRTRDEGADNDDISLSSSTSMAQQTEQPSSKIHVAPLIAAQVLVVLYLLWSFASSRWSLAPELAIGGSILLAIHFLWASALGHGLSPSAARLATRAVVAAMAVTAVVAIWYHYGRKPTMRADFPVGNPSFLSACLIPGILLAGGIVCERIMGAIEARRARPLVFAIPALAVIVVSLWAFYVADARGPYIGLLFGVLAMAFFALRGRARMIPTALAVAVAVVGWFYVAGLAQTYSPTGRSATLRLRTYAWTYAWQMFNDRPFTGHGQGGFVLTGDSHVVKDVINDPLVFASRIAHAHNEWIEVMADLGSVGIVLIVAVLLLTLRAGMVALGTLPSRADRWALVGLMGSLVGLIVEEGSGVGLRVSGVGILFYSVIGLIWALSGKQNAGLKHSLSLTRGRRLLTGVAGVVLGLAVLVIAGQDFAAARNVHSAAEALRAGSYDDAIRLASQATDRLNPQRALTGLYQLSETHRIKAQMLQDRAINRERRAYEIEPPNQRLLALADEDYRVSDEHCKAASEALKALVVRSPGFFNHGRLGYWINLIRAGNAAAHNDREKQQALLKDAAAWIKRELLRQPFSPSIALDYVRVAGPTLGLAEVIEVLARPLRHHGITEPYVAEPYIALLRELAVDPEFDRHFAPLVDQAKLALTSAPIDDQNGEAGKTWAPEKLRLAAVILSIRGDYSGARTLLEQAVPVYDTLATSAPLGAAGCYDELAICRFFSDPSDPEAVLKSASRAISLAPDSRLGRQLKSGIRQRMIEYYLASGNEEETKRLLRETGPYGVTEDDIIRELAARYRRMCESLLSRREAGGALRKPPAQLAPTLSRWVERAIELNPNDPLAHHLAADLAFYLGDDLKTAMHLRDAINQGLPVEQAVQFLRLALDQRPDSETLKSLWQALAPPEAPVEAPEGRIDPPQPGRTPGDESGP